MLPTNIISGSAFRLALQLVMVFIAMLILAGTILVVTVTTTLEDELLSQIQEEVILFQGIYTAKGVQGLISVINNLAISGSTRDVNGLFDDSKLHLAGQISLLPNFIGWRKTELTLSGNKAGEQAGKYHTRLVKMGEMSLVVGRSTHIIDKTKSRLVFWLFVAGFGLSIGTLLLGYLASARSFRKLQAMEQTLQAVSEGNMQARIEASDANGQIDRIAQQMNQHLDHLSNLVSGVKSTASAIAHDLKTPLSHARIALYKAIELCNKGGKPTDAIADALDELDQLNLTFDTILRISRIQSQFDRSAFMKFELLAVIEKVIDLLEPIAQDANIKLLKQVDTIQPLFLMGDVGMIQQLLINLVNNAIVHCPAGSEVILFASQSKTQLVLSVKDNGAGIPAVARDEVLKPFSRLDSARTRPGSGLGLALVSAIVEYHKATISLEDAHPGLQINIKFPIS